MTLYIPGVIYACDVFRQFDISCDQIGFRIWSWFSYFSESYFISESIDFHFYINISNINVL